jgi:hypothetical protein
MIVTREWSLRKVFFECIPAITLAIPNRAGVLVSAACDEPNAIKVASKAMIFLCSQGGLCPILSAMKPHLETTSM